MVSDEEAKKIVKKHLKVLDNGYIFDKRIFNTAMILMFVFLFTVLCIYNFDFSSRPYVKCDSQEECKNPFYIDPTCQGIMKVNGCNPNLDPKCAKYEECNAMPMKYKLACKESWCNQSTLSPGFEGGSKPGKLYNGFIIFLISELTLAFIINHLIWNRKDKNEQDTNQSNK